MARKVSFNPESGEHPSNTRTSFRIATVSERPREPTLQNPKTIELLEGKFKLGHEHNEADRASLLEHLKAEKPVKSVCDLTAAFFRTHPVAPPKA